LEEQGHDLFQGTVLTFACYDRRMPQHAKPVMAKVQIISFLDKLLLTAFSFHQPTQQTQKFITDQSGESGNK
jgi:hypothetical protein